MRLIPFFLNSGINYNPEDRVTARIVGLSPGKTKLRLNVTVSGIAAGCPSKKSVTFTDAIDVDVFEGLVLTEPMGVSSKSVLMAPYSSLQIRTNMDSMSKLSYKYVVFALCAIFLYTILYLRLIGEDSSESRFQTSLTIPDPLVTITDDGILRARGNLGYSMVLIIAQDEYGLLQTLSVIVEVKLLNLPYM